MELITLPYPGQRIIRILSDKADLVSNRLPDARLVQAFPGNFAHFDVAWTQHNMTVLTQLLQPAVSTVFDGYKFPGVFRPFRHQLKIVDLLTRAPRAYCFAGMGTGKTMASLWALDYLMTTGVVKKVLVVCPKSLMFSAWVEDKMKTCVHRTHTVLYGDRAQREKLAERNTDIDIVNFDGVEILIAKLATKEYDLIIVDESTAYKDPSTKRWKALSKLVKPTTRVWALTGTPTPQGPMDAYGQGKLVTPERVPRTKTAFQSETMFKVATFIWKPKHNWQEIVKDMLQPAIYIRKEDCLDLPAVTRTFREVGLSKPQQQAVKALKDDMLAVFDAGHEAVAANAAVLHGKLRQIYAGAIYTTDGAALALDNKARIKETIDLIAQAKAQGDDSVADGKPHSKALVFVPFRHVMTVLEAELSKHYDVAVISGDTSVPERTRILQQFQTTTAIDVILAIPEAFSHGVTATAASLTVWYAPPSRTETYLQACERTDRPGQTQLQNVVHLYGDNTERAMYQNLIDNKNNQEQLLKLYYNVLGKEAT